jgi:hypothetical protein
MATTANPILSEHTVARRGAGSVRDDPALSVPREAAAGRQLFNDLPSVWVPERPMPPNMNLWGHRSFGRPDHPSTGVDVDPAAGGDVEATPLPRQPTFGSPDSRKEPPESAKRNKTRGEISRKYGVNCSRSVADPRSGANKPRILEPVRTILKKSEGCLRHKSCCPDQTWSTGKR